MNKDPLRSVAGFDWDNANIFHIGIHKVTVEEAEDIFFDVNNRLDDDAKHSLVEDRFIIIGKTQKGRILYQIFTKRNGKIRVISSRDINKKEVYLYEKKASRSKV